jgi:hypothetical protein
MDALKHGFLTFHQLALNAAALLLVPVVIHEYDGEASYPARAPSGQTG